MKQHLETLKMYISFYNKFKKKISGLSLQESILLCFCFAILILHGFFLSLNLLFFPEILVSIAKVLLFILSIYKTFKNLTEVEKITSSDIEIEGGVSNFLLAQKFTKAIFIVRFIFLILSITGFCYFLNLYSTKQSTLNILLSEIVKLNEDLISIREESENFKQIIEDKNLIINDETQEVASKK